MKHTDTCPGFGRTGALARRKPPPSIRATVFALALCSACADASPQHAQPLPDEPLLAANLLALNADQCPEGTRVVLGTEGPDVLEVAEQGERPCIQSGGDKDRIISFAERTLVHAGDGHDEVTLHKEYSEVYAGGGSDRVEGSPGADYVEGGPGMDILRGKGGSDRLLGQDGDDILDGGEGADILFPGKGKDQSYGGAGDDILVVMDACQVEPGEILNGGSGTDVLISTVDAAQLVALGVSLHSIEEVRIVPSEVFNCDAGCNCTESFPPLDFQLCEFQGLEDEEVDLGALRSACKDFIGAIPSLIVQLPSAATDDDWYQLVETRNPEWLQAFGQLGEVVGHRQGPESHPSAAPGPLQLGVSTELNTCDRPTADLHVGVNVGGINNCEAREETRLRELLDIASFQVWRMSQIIDAVLSAPGQAEAEALWNQGDWLFSLQTWFGPYSERSALIVRETVNTLWNKLHGDDDSAVGFDDNIQCYNPLDGGQTFGFLFTSPATVLAKTLTNPCWYSHRGRSETHAHSAFTIPGVGRVASAVLGYPFRSVEVCRNFFSGHDLNDPEERVPAAAILLHEMLHFTSNAQGTLRDHHGADDNGICEVGNPCSNRQQALDLASQAPDIALQSIINYHEWAITVGSRYLSGYCDTTHNPVCSPSNCCGNGLRDSHELCEVNDVNGVTCSDVVPGLIGPVSCTADCHGFLTDQCIDPDDVAGCSDPEPPIVCTAATDCPDNLRCLPDTTLGAELYCLCRNVEP